MRGEKRLGRSNGARGGKGGEWLRSEGREKGGKRHEGRKGQGDSSTVMGGEKSRELQEHEGGRRRWKSGSSVRGQKGGKEQWREERKGRGAAEA